MNGRSVVVLFLLAALLNLEAASATTPTHGGTGGRAVSSPTCRTDRQIRSDFDKFLKAIGGDRPLTDRKALLCTGPVVADRIFPLLPTLYPLWIAVDSLCPRGLSL